MIRKLTYLIILSKFVLSVTQEMKLSESLLVVWLLSCGVLGEHVIDNKVSTRGKISTLEISSTQYNIPNIELYLVNEEDEFIYRAGEKSSFVVTVQGDELNAFGYIEAGRFFGQFTYDGKTYAIEPVPSGQTGGKLIPLDEIKGLIGGESLSCL